MNMRYVILYFVLKYKNNWEQIYNALETKEKIKRATIATVIASFTENENVFATLIEKAYPSAYKRMPFPPFLVPVDMKKFQKITTELREKIPALRLEA